MISRGYLGPNLPQGQKLLPGPSHGLRVGSTLNKDVYLVLPAMPCCLTLPAYTEVTAQPAGAGNANCECSSSGGVCLKGTAGNSPQINCQAGYVTADNNRHYRASCSNSGQWQNMQDCIRKHLYKSLFSILDFSVLFTGRGFSV